MTNTNEKIRTRKAFLIGMIVAVPAFGLLTMGLTATTAHADAACPDPGQCTCNAASGVMTDHAMAPPFNRINNGCTHDA